MTRVAITGGTGRMGQELQEELTDRSDTTLAAVFSQSGNTAVSDVPTGTPETAEQILDSQQVDVLIDFTVPQGTETYLDAAIATDTPMVIGTTGFSEDQFAELQEASGQIPVLKAANFARGIQTLFRLAAEAAAALPDYDVELIETHHNGKRDAPSGTAGRILDAIDAGTDQRVHGRSGHAPREEDDVGVHAVRAGQITGIHELLLAGNHEELRLTHRAEDRGVFAAGAVDAAVWLAAQEPGWYDFQAVLDE